MGLDSTSLKQTCEKIKPRLNYWRIDMFQLDIDFVKVLMEVSKRKFVLAFLDNNVFLKVVLDKYCP